MNLALSFLTGLLFAIGLGISGMLDPLKVRGFLDITGDWDPALIFVMVGGIGFHMIFYQLLIKKRRAPVFEMEFKVPDRKDISWPLISGSALFGTGWGLSGLCPGPVVVSMASLDQNLALFALAMLAGIFAAEFLKKRISS